MSMLDAALDLAAADQKIIPCSQKRPTNKGGLRKASSDSTQIIKWFTDNPYLQIGMMMPPGSLAIDCDVRKGGTFERAVEILGPLPPTLQNVSGRGDGGGHWIYAFDGGPISRHHTNGTGIDILVHGYIIVPPSLHHETGKPYEWIHRPIVALPEQARRVLTQVPRIASRPTPLTGEFGPSYYSLEALLRVLNRYPVQGINSALFWTAHRALDSGRGAEYENALVQCAISLGESPHRAQATYSSAAKKRGSR